MVVDRGQALDLSHLPLAALVRDAWNDEGFVTMFHLVVVDTAERVHQIGTVKIGRYGQADRRNTRTDVPERFDALPDEYFSLGQDDTYYRQLADLGDMIRIQVLTGLRDMAFDRAIFEHARDESVTIYSLLRFVRASTVEEQFARIARGGARVLAFEVDYRLVPANGDESNELHMTFRATPGSLPPTNVHVITGSNGAGKSVLLSRMARAAGNPPGGQETIGRFTEHGRAPQRQSFTNLVSVSFSAFDTLPEAVSTPAFPVDYVGLRATVSDGATVRRTRSLKTPEQLLKLFAKSVEACLTGERSERWTKAVRTLMYANSGLLEEGWLDRFRATSNAAKRKSEARRVFRNLSSGHKVALLTVTRLVELVGERTLVIIDEPESHLHPPLLSALVRAISDLLTDLNALAIIATHSPVVLQEVPARCVYKLRRFGDQLFANRPALETFGENVGILTQEVFGLEVTNTGFHQDIKDLVAAGFSFDQIMTEFGGQLGGEAQIIARSLVATREFDEWHGEERR
ncbi:AAA family ATPase [Kitasatospora phosalacinea]|nr:AAA family ATPase [Kitasatospora phosalacinea]